MKLNRYQQGYQDALVDIANALEAGGEDLVIDWIKNNTLRGHVYGA